MADDATGAAPLSIVAGAGSAPLIVARAAREAGRKLLVVGLRGEASGAIAEFPHDWIGWGQLGRLVDLMKANGSGDIVLVGGVRGRPDFRSLKIDLGTLRSLPEILSIMAGGDDSVLSGAVRLFEGRGFRVLGAHEVARELVCDPGVLTRRAPSDSERADLALGFRAAKAIGALDIGQATVTVNGQVIAVEGPEGTDAMLDRVADLRRAHRVHWRGRSGVLVKCAKPQQDLRVDMPTVGPRTVEKLTAAGLAGIGVEAGRVMLVDRPDILRAADAAGMFLSAETVSWTPVP